MAKVQCVALEDGDPLRRIFETSAEWVSILAPDGRVLFVNETGRQALSREGRTCGSRAGWVDSWDRGAQQKAARAIRNASMGKPARFTARRLDADATARWWDVGLSLLPAAEGVQARIVVIARDISDHKRAEERLQWAATHDSLTLLPNRALFQARLEEEIEKARMAGGSFGLLLLDIDEFKRVNDVLGHDTGDALLCELARRLRAATRKDDFVARLGGDEFAIILRNLADEGDLAGAAAAILERLKEPCVRDGRALDCHASIGASIFPVHGPSKLELMKNADIALYSAKDAGRGTFRIFAAAMRSGMQVKHSMLALAKDALAQHRMVPFYQPQIDLRTGRLQGFEALMRWHHPTNGPQSPGTVKAAFEDERLAVSISDRMIELVIRDMRRWIDEGVQFGYVAINASAAEFRRGQFAERLLSQLTAADIPTSRLQLEVTETVFLGRGGEDVGRALKTMHAAGIQIALDDFGTGYASLSHLKQFPVSIIKIDKSFVRDLHEDPDDEAIVRAVISLGQSLHIKVVAEGIETPAQSAYLRKYSCDYGQGFLFGAAGTAAAVPALVERLARQGSSPWQIGRRAHGAAGAEPCGGLADEPRKLNPPNGHAAGEGSPSARYVYIVDDHREIRESTMFLLQAMGYRCRSFASGSAFLSAFLDLPPGCVLLDVRMDGLDGYQVLSELRWMDAAWAVVVMSGHVDDDLASSLRAAGAHAVLAKPFDEGLLCRAMDSVFLRIADDCRDLGAVPALQ